MMFWDLRLDTASWMPRQAKKREVMILGGKTLDQFHSRQQARRIKETIVTENQDKQAEPEKK